MRMSSEKQKPYPILFLHSSNEMYGSDKVLFQIISGLDKELFEPIVILPSDIHYEGKLSQALDGIGVRNYSVTIAILRRKYFSLGGGVQLLFNYLSGLWRIWLIARKHKVSLIHSNTSAVLGGGVVAFFLGIPHIRHVHEILKQPEWLGKIIYSMICVGSQQVVAISSAVAEALQSSIGCLERKITLIWNGIDTDVFSPQVSGKEMRKEWGIPEDGIVVSVVGRISHWKGQEVFLDAAHSLLDNPSLYFIIIGDPIQGDEQRLLNLKKKVAFWEQKNRVIFVQYDNRIAEVMRAIDILVVPSILPEPFGLVVIEAMASERCVVAFAHGGVKEIVNDSTGLLVTPNNVNALRNAILKLALDENMRNQMGRHGRRRVIQNFSLTKFKNEFNDLYLSIIQPTTLRQKSK